MAALVSAVLLHVVLGLALAALVWGVGAGLVAGRGDAVDGYPFGLLAVTAAAFLVLLSPWLALAAVPLLVLPLTRVRLPRIDARTSAVAAVPVAAVPIAFGLMYHGPTATLPSAANGETLAWASRVSAAAESVVPYHDLLAEGQRVVYAEAASSIAGGALAWLPGFDSILFHTTSLTAFGLVSIVVGLWAMRPDGAATTSALWVSLVALLALTTVIYPSYLVESAPVALAVPLAFAAYRLWEGRPSPLRVAVVGGAIAVGLLLTKVIALLAVGIAVGYALYARHWSGLDARRRAIALGAVATAGVLVVASLLLTAAWFRHLFELRFLPAGAARDLWAQREVRNAATAAPAFQVLGQVALLVALARARVVGLALALAATVVATWFLGGQAFYMAQAFVTLWTALFFWRDRAALAAQRVPLVLAAVSLGLWSWLQDISGVRVAAFLIALTFVGLVAGLARRPSAVPVAGAGAIAFAALALGGFTLLDRFDAYGPSDYDIWHRVDEDVPADGLVFTSLTGPQVDLRHGWNNYPAIARRQVYISGWYDGRLTAEPEERNRRLALNARVLRGALNPSRLDYSQPFGSYWAVVAAGASVPTSFRRVYANDGFALYRIES